MGINELWLFELSESLPNHMEYLIFLHDEISIRCSAESLHVHWIIAFMTVCFIYFGTRLIFVAIVGYLKIIAYSKGRTPLVVANYQIILIFWDSDYMRRLSCQKMFWLLWQYQQYCHNAHGKLWHYRHVMKLEIFFPNIWGFLVVLGDIWAFLLSLSLSKWRIIFFLSVVSILLPVTLS